MAKKKLRVLNHLNGLHKIQFTTEKEEEGHLPFLDIDIYRKTGRSLRHKVYWKPTHTNLYLHQNLHHHPANKQSVLASLLHRAKALCDQNSLTQELEFLTTVFKTMDTALNRYDEPWNRQHKLPRPMTNLCQLHTYHTPKQHTANSADCWPNTTSKVSPYHIQVFSYLPPVERCTGIKNTGYIQDPM
jgi:hypothetical protein